MEQWSSTEVTSCRSQLLVNGADIQTVTSSHSRTVCPTCWFKERQLAPLLKHESSILCALLEEITNTGSILTLAKTVCLCAHRGCPVPSHQAQYCLHRLSRQQLTSCSTLFQAVIAHIVVPSIINGRQYLKWTIIIPIHSCSLRLANFCLDNITFTFVISPIYINFLNFSPHFLWAIV